MTVAIVDYGSGNLRSAAKALERAAREAGLAVSITVTDAPEVVAAAERIVLPGVGAFADCMAGLTGLAGMTEALEEAVLGRGRPFLGICVGMQLMAERGLEHGTHDGLGWIPGEVRALAPAPGPDGRALKVPHMGWNEIVSDGSHALLEETGDNPHFYFVHGYHLVASQPAQVFARTDYGQPIAALVGRDNLAGTQFHPEKSQAAGLALLRNFLMWSP